MIKDKYNLGIVLWKGNKRVSITETVQGPKKGGYNDKVRNNSGTGNIRTSVNSGKDSTKHITRYDEISAYIAKVVVLYTNMEYMKKLKNKTGNEMAVNQTTKLISEYALKIKVSEGMNKKYHADTNKTEVNGREPPMGTKVEVHKKG